MNAHLLVGLLNIVAFAVLVIIRPVVQPGNDRRLWWFLLLTNLTSAIAQFEAARP